MCYLVGFWSTLGKINPLNAPFSPVENANCLYLHDLALLKAAQGFGVGRRLIQAATGHALENAADAIALLSVQNSIRLRIQLHFSCDTNCLLQSSCAR